MKNQIITTEEVQNSIRLAKEAYVRTKEANALLAKMIQESRDVLAHGRDCMAYSKGYIATGQVASFNMYTAK